MSELTEWDSCYVIVGSAAAALIGLQFVVMTLLAEKPPPRAEEAAPAFATPTIVHFSTVLFLSAILRAPWPAIAPVEALWGLVGVGGAVYTGIVARRTHLQAAFQRRWRTGYSTWSYLSPRTPRWRSQQLLRRPTAGTRCSVSQLQHYYRCSARFITPATPSFTTCWKICGMARIERELSTNWTIAAHVNTRL